MVKLGGSRSFRVSGGVVGRLGFRDGVSASYSYFRRVGNFGISHTAAMWLSPAKDLIDILRYENRYWTVTLIAELAESVPM